MQKNSIKMQGTLWKWTNYFSGWQPRWFVLENGILSYYRAQEDVVNGCKGSIKMSVCDVSVHASDPTRLDLIIPGEAHFYVKAATSQERQEWLIALGSCKAGVIQKPPTVDAQDIQGEMKAKKSELRLYCDLLMQQVYSVKAACPPGQVPEMQQLKEATSLLRATCDTFITSLDDCMQLVNASGRASERNTPTGGPVTPPFKNSGKQPTFLPGLTSTSRQSSTERRTSSPTDENGIVRGYVPSPQRRSRSRTPSDNSSPPQPKTSSSYASVTESPSQGSDDNSEFQPAVESFSPDSQASHTDVMSFGDANSSVKVDEQSSPAHKSKNDVQLPANFFRNLKTSFRDVQILADQGIPTAQFLNVCRELLPFFDKLNAMAYAPMKIDFTTHIKKVQQKLSSDPDCFCTVQYIIKYEVQKIQHINDHSATKSLIWLKRTLDFMTQFLQEFTNGAADLQLASNNAYSASLKEFHSYIVRNVYTTAVKSAPSRQDFVLALLDIPEGQQYEITAETCLLEDIKVFLHHATSILDILDNVFNQNNVNGIAVM